VPITPGMTVSHSSNREHIGEHNDVHGYIGGKSPKPKHGSAVTPVHGGMVHVTNGKTNLGGGDHKSALDSLSGASVPAGKRLSQAEGEMPVFNLVIRSRRSRRHCAETIDGLRCKTRMLSDADLGCVNGPLAESIIDELRTWSAAA
jgi:hypothetical protein